MPTWYRERLAEHMSAVTVCQSPLRVTLRPQALAIDLFGHDIVVADHGEHLFSAVPMLTPGSPLIAV
jgi:hypothetical protein